MARALALAAAIAVSLLAVSGAGGSGVQAPKRGGTVVFGPIAEPRCLNPLVVGTCGDGIPSFFWITEKVLTPAFTVAPDFTLEPQLVSGVTVTKKRPFTITYRIRPEARWSDRVPVTARDFVFTHKAIRKYFPPDFDPGHRTMVRTVLPLDTKTVRVVLRTRFAGWRGLFQTVLPRHALRGANLATVWSDDLNNPKTGRPIGNGPFLVGSWERGKQLTLVRNRNYWGPRVSYLDKLVVRFQEGGVAPPPLEVLEGLREKEVDFALSRDTGIVPDLRRMPGIRVFHTTTNFWEHLEIRTRPPGHPALENKLVRRALAYGIDRVAIARQLFAELDPRYRPSDSAVFLANHVSHRPNWAGYRYRPAESKRLLRLAGCRPAADGIFVCAGRPLELRLLTIAGSRLRERHVELIQTQLRRVGIEVRLSFAAPTALFEQILPSGDFDLVSFVWSIDPEAAGWKGVYGCRGQDNYTGYCQRLVTSDLDQAERILDADKRNRVLNRADQQLAKDVPVLPLYEVPFVLALRTTVRNVVFSANNLFWNAEDWWLER